MIRLRDIAIRPAEGEARLRAESAALLGLRERDILSLKIRRKSIDARKKNAIRAVYTVDVEIKGDEARAMAHAGGKAKPAVDTPYRQPKATRLPKNRPVIVGFGPAGMFAALILARAGLKPLILERGQDIDTRTETVHRFWETGKLDPECNVQFGEGGAGTFSDGKLNTGIKNERIAFVLESFHAFGADESITVSAKPHIGTDVLRRVVKALREELLSLGAELRFGCKMERIETENGAVCAVVTAQGERIPCDALLLAIGHSARDSFEMLHALGVPMEPKAFSLGVRIEQKQAAIDQAQYADFPREGLGAADYALHVHFPEGDSAYTFCMCPGGYVVAAASEEGRVVTNGMSNFARDAENANSALLVTVTPADFPNSSVLGGMEWQREIEHRAFLAGGGTYRAPAQRVGDFLAGKPSRGAGTITPSYRPGVTWCDLHGVLPEKICTTLEKALPALGKKLHGFDAPDAVLTAPETRSSSPVRILRGENRQSALRGLFPCGEGAGYAGGITSAAVDGMVCAEALIEFLNQFEN